MSHDEQDKPRKTQDGHDGHAGRRAHHGHAAHRGGSHEEHEGAPEWLISFADNTVLLMGFFVIMLAMNMAVKASSSSDASEPSEAAAASGQTARQLDFALGVRDAFNNPVTLNSNRPEDKFLVMRLREKLAGENPHADETVQGRSDLAQSLDRGYMEHRVGAIHFAQNATRLDANAEATIRSFASRARGLSQVVEVRGHASVHEASTLPGHGVPLSYDRAYAVAERLHLAGLPWHQMRLIAAGSAEPVHHRAYTREENDVNSRVELVMTEELMVP